MKVEVQGRLDACRKRLHDLGPERNSSAEQMGYLIDLASQFQRLVSLALNATHGADHVFDTSPAMRIAPAVMSRMKTFSDEMAKYGEVYSFMPREGNEASSSPVQLFEGIDAERAEELFDVRKEDDLEDLGDILHPRESLPHPRRGEIKGWLLGVFRCNRSFELGTFSGSILATAMNKQCRKWTDISMGFVSDVIILVHVFINSAFASICSDRAVREAVTNKLSDELIKRYQKAIDSTKFLLEVEHSDTPMTLNHYFNDNLQKR